MKIVVILITVLLLLAIYVPVYSDDIPSRIISLGPVITEELFLLGAGDNVVGVTIHCIKPDKAKDIERVGDLTDINIEKVLQLNPDIVLATSLTDPKEIKVLEKYNIKVISFPYYESFPDICNQFIQLGTIVGKKEKAEKIVLEKEKEIKSLVAKTRDLSHPSVFIQIGAKPLFTVTGKTFINDFIMFAGGENVTADLTGTGIYSREEVLRQNPDIIIISAMGIVGEAEKEKWEELGIISAVKNNRIYVMDPYKLCSPTPVSFVETLKEVINILHPGWQDDAVVSRFLSQEVV